MRQFDVEAYARPDLYRAVSDYAAKKPMLAGEDARLLEKELLDFRRSGAGLPAKKRERLKRLRRWIVELEGDFVRNVEADTPSILVSSAELAGLPDDWVSRLKREGPLYRVTVAPPDYGTFMSNARDEKSRLRLQLAASNRASVDNLPLLKRLLDMRREAAQLLGYPSHAAYVLDDRMAKDPKAVDRFLDRLIGELQPAGRRELAELSRLNGGRPVRDWDFRYLDARQLERHEVDEQEVREYFPLDMVMPGMLSVYEKMLGVRFKKLDAPAPQAAWDPDASLYEVDDAADGRVLAYFYTDLYAREGKYSTPQSEDLIDGRRLSDGSYQKPVAVLMADLPKPQPGRPVLLRHHDVWTLFHEFGHVMHMTLTKAAYGRFSGVNVAQDFVETPSQMLENWVWNPAVLKSISGRYDDPSKKLPDALLQKMLAARDVDAALKTLQKLRLSAIDMAYHGPDRVKDTTKVWRRLQERVSLIPLIPGGHPEASFDHLQDGYDAGYYGYLWSEVYADDMFARFKAAGLKDPILGRRFREQILEPGGGRDEAESLRRFLGREPSDAAFLERLGLAGTRK